MSPVAVPRIRVVLLNWNDRPQSEACLARVMASRGVRPDVVVVDNGSSGDDARHFRDRLGDDRVVALPENTGYAGGMNAGLAFWLTEGSADSILVITPDAAVEPDTLDKLERELSHRANAAIVGPLVIHSHGDDRQEVSAGGRIEPARVSASLLRKPLSERPYDADWIDGCCMLIRPDVLADVEPFDERFFIYYEETDFCTRVRRAGWRIRVVPDAVVFHPKSPGTLPPYYFYYMVRNRYLFWRKNFGIGMGRVALVVAALTLKSWASVGRSLVQPRRRPDWRRRLRDARLQLRAAWGGTIDHVKARYGRIPDSRLRRAGT